MSSNIVELFREYIISRMNCYKMTKANLSVRFELANACEHLKELIENNGWISVNDDLPTHSDQYWVAYRPINNHNPNEKITELCYCTAHFNSYDKIWSVKDQLLYTQRRCKVLFWQPIIKPAKEKLND